MMLRMSVTMIFLASTSLSFTMDYFEEFWPEAPLAEHISSESERIFNSASKAIFSDDGKSIIKVDDHDQDAIYPLTSLAKGNKQGITKSIITHLECARLTHSHMRFPRDNENFDTLCSLSHAISRSMDDDGASILITPLHHYRKECKKRSGYVPPAYGATLDHTESTRNQLSVIPIALVDVGVNKPVIVYGDRIRMYKTYLAQQVKLIDVVSKTKCVIDLPDSNHFFHTHIRISNHNNAGKITIAASMQLIREPHENRIYFIDAERTKEDALTCKLSDNQFHIDSPHVVFNWLPNKPLLLIAEHVHTKNFLGIPRTQQAILSYCPHNNHVVSKWCETIESDCSECCCLYRSSFEVSPDGKMIIIDKQVRTLPEAFVNAMAVYLHAKENILPVPAPCVINQTSFIEQARESISTLHATASNSIHPIIQLISGQFTNLVISRAEEDNYELSPEHATNQEHISHESDDRL